MEQRVIAYRPSENEHIITTEQYAGGVKNLDDIIVF